MLIYQSHISKRVRNRVSPWRTTFPTKHCASCHLVAEQRSHVCVYVSMERSQADTRTQFIVWAVIQILRPVYQELSAETDNGCGNERLVSLKTHRGKTRGNYCLLIRSNGESELLETDMPETNLNTVLLLNSGHYELCIVAWQNCLMKVGLFVLTCRFFRKAWLLNLNKFW